MSGICGGQEPLLNLTALWETDNPNLPRCFSRTVLTILPAIVLAVNWVQALAQLRPTLSQGRSSSSSSKEGWEESVSWTIVTRATLLWLLLALKIALVAVDTHTETEAASTADYLYYSISILVLVLNLSIQVIGCCVVRANTGH